MDEKVQYPLPIGMVQTDAEKIRYAWGVKSLTWPILTDNQHIVIAEGFEVNELGDKIKRND